MVELYRLLNVTRQATLNDIKSSYRKLALELHPDRNGGSAAKTAQFRSITAAYEVLSDDKKRTDYDRSLGYSSLVTSKRPYKPPPRPHQNPTPRASTAASAPPPPPGTFNVEMWEAWHYGEGAEAQPSVKQKNSWMNLVRPASFAARVRAITRHRISSPAIPPPAPTCAQVNNKHQSYFARKAAREAHERKQRMREAAEAAAEAEASSADPGEALRMKRDARRQAGDGGGAAGQTKESGVVS